MRWAETPEEELYRMHLHRLSTMVRVKLLAEIQFRFIKDLAWFVIRICEASGKFITDMLHINIKHTYLRRGIQIIVGVIFEQKDFDIMRKAQSIIKIAVKCKILRQTDSYNAVKFVCFVEFPDFFNINFGICHIRKDIETVIDYFNIIFLFSLFKAIIIISVSLFYVLHQIKILIF